MSKPAQYEYLYNKDMKDFFLKENYPHEATQENYRQTFFKSYKLEKFYNTDLCDFNYKQMKELLIKFGNKSYGALRKEKTVVRKYIEWAISEGHRKSAIDMTGLLDDEEIKNSANKIAINSKYITREELYEMCKNIDNKQDAVMLVLYFEGIRGRTEKGNSNEEIKNLKITHCNFDKNEITVYQNDGYSRTIQNVDPRSMQIIKEADDEKIYYQKSERWGTNPYAEKDLIPTEYVIKATKSKDRKTETVDDKIRDSLINSRYKKLKELTGKDITPTSVFQSGFIDQCEQRRKKNGELTETDYKDIVLKFNLDIIKNKHAYKTVYLDWLQNTTE